MIVTGESAERARIVGKYIVENKATVRQAAKKMGISKTTVYEYITERLPYVDKELYKKVREVLEHNASQRTTRGGEATRKMYLNKK